MKYKERVPVCGGILLNPGLTHCVLVKGWKSSASWGFPKGKINAQEEPIKCAAREVYEEIGYDISDKIDSRDYIRVTMGGKEMVLFVVKGVQDDALFETMTRKEISVSDEFMLIDPLIDCSNIVSFHRPLNGLG